MYIYVRGGTCICICMHMREGVTISLEGEYNSYRRIDWLQLDERSEVMVGNGNVGISETAKRSILSRERKRKP